MNKTEYDVKFCIDGCPHLVERRPRTDNTIIHICNMIKEVLSKNKKKPASEE